MQKTTRKRCNLIFAKNKTENHTKKLEALKKQIKKLQNRLTEEIQGLRTTAKPKNKILPHGDGAGNPRDKKTDETQEKSPEKPDITLRLAWARQKLADENIKFTEEPSVIVAERKYEYFAMIPADETLNVALVSVGYGEATYFVPQNEWRFWAQNFKRDLREIQLFPGELCLELIDDSFVWQAEFWTRMKLACEDGTPVQKTEKTSEKREICTNLEIFKQQLSEVVEFREKNGRLPSERSKDKKEKKLGVRIVTWREGFKNMQRIKNGEKPKGSNRLSPEKQKLILKNKIPLKNLGGIGKNAKFENPKITLAKITQKTSKIHKTAAK